MHNKDVILTVEGLKKLEGELLFLKTKKRQEVAERIKQAREFGDISENSEYEDAKHEQAFIEGRILTLEKKLRNAKIIDSDAVDIDAVGLGSFPFARRYLENRFFFLLLRGTKMFQFPRFCLIHLCYLGV